jgi:hypothetical protein
MRELALEGGRSVVEVPGVEGLVAFVGVTGDSVGLAGEVEEFCGWGCEFWFAGGDANNVLYGHDGRFAV